MNDDHEAAVRIHYRQGIAQIAIPRGALFEKDGRRIVYCPKDGRFVPVEVTVGPNSVARVVITKGLVPGDLVALRDPAETAGRLFGGSEARPARP